MHAEILMNQRSLSFIFFNLC